MHHYDNVILTDVDGVLIYWEHAFRTFMETEGFGHDKLAAYEIEDMYGISTDLAVQYLKKFGDSIYFKKIPPLNDAIKYVKKLHEDHGFVFHAISAVPERLTEQRTENIHNLFGKTAFDKITLCEFSGNKPDYLKHYKDTGCFWIEDVGKNAEMGLDWGLKPLLMDRHHNKAYNHPDIPRVQSWKEIYAHVIGNTSHPIDK